MKHLSPLALTALIAGPALATWNQDAAPEPAVTTTARAQTVAGYAPAPADEAVAALAALEAAVAAQDPVAAPRAAAAPAPPGHLARAEAAASIEGANQQLDDVREVYLQRVRDQYNEQLAQLERQKAELQDRAADAEARLRESIASQQQFQDRAAEAEARLRNAAGQQQGLERQQVEQLARLAKERADLEREAAATLARRAAEARDVALDEAAEARAAQQRALAEAMQERAVTGARAAEVRELADAARLRAMQERDMAELRARELAQVARARALNEELDRKRAGDEEVARMRRDEDVDLQRQLDEARERLHTLKAELETAQQAAREGRRDFEREAERETRRNAEREADRDASRRTRERSMGGLALAPGEGMPVEGAPPAAGGIRSEPQAPRSAFGRAAAPALDPRLEVPGMPLAAPAPAPSASAQSNVTIVVEQGDVHVYTGGGGAPQIVTRGQAGPAAPAAPAAPRTPRPTVAFGPSGAFGTNGGWVGAPARAGSTFFGGPASAPSGRGFGGPARASGGSGTWVQGSPAQAETQAPGASQSFGAWLSGPKGDPFGGGDARSGETFWSAPTQPATAPQPQSDPSSGWRWSTPSAPPAPAAPPAGEAQEGCAPATFFGASTGASTVALPELVEALTAAASAVEVGDYGAAYTLAREAAGSGTSLDEQELLREILTLTRELKSEVGALRSELSGLRAEVLNAPLATKAPVLVRTLQGGAR